MSAPSPFRFEQAMSALLAARARMLAEEPDTNGDDGVLDWLVTSDWQAGQAMEVLDRVISESIEQGCLHKAAKERAKQINERADRFERRQGALRALAFAALDALGVSKRTTGEFTASIVAGKPSVLITDEPAIPPEYIQEVTVRKIDKTLLADDLKAGVIVSGAELTNGQSTIMIRTK